MHCTNPALLAIAFLASTVHASTPTAPIESYVAPAGQFPAESNYGGRTPAPLAAYDAPKGTLVGHIRLERPDCLRPSKSDAPQCTFPHHFVYKPMGKPSIGQVQLAEWGYETMGMVSYTPSVKDGDHAWSQVRYTGGSVWVKTRMSEVHPYEDVAYLTNAIEVFCASPGARCHPVSHEERTEMKRFANLTTCYDTPYTIVSRVMHAGRRYYKLDINTSAEHKTTLPHPIYVPTRNPDGSHTGGFFARGC